MTTVWPMALSVFNNSTVTLDVLRDQSIKTVAKLLAKTMESLLFIALLQVQNNVIGANTSIIDILSNCFHHSITICFSFYEKGLNSTNETENRNMNIVKDSERSGRKTNSSDGSNEPTVKPEEPESFRNYCEEKFDEDTDEENTEDPTEETGKIIVLKLSNCIFWHI